MDFLDVVRRRHMVRRFATDREVDDASYERIIDAALRAPTAGFSQGVEVLVLRDSEERERFWAVTTTGDPANAWLHGMRTAPTLILVLADEARYRARYAEPDKAAPAADPDRWSAPFWYVDAGMAAHAMLLAAVNEGLGACFFGVPRERVAAVAEQFAVPAAWHIVGVLALGPADRATKRRTGSASRPRRKRTDVVHHGTIGQPSGSERDIRA